jgi:hypothetical protein
MSSGFDNYMNREDWSVGNYNPEQVARPHSRKCNKYFYNKKYETDGIFLGKLIYPHIPYRWVQDTLGKVIGRGRFSRWQKQRSLKMEDQCTKIIWEAFSETFTRRQNRMKSIMESQNKVLFLRVDDSRVMGERYSSAHDTLIDNSTKVEYFIESICKTYPTLNFGYLQYYLDSLDTRKMKEISSDTCHVEKIPEKLISEGMNNFSADWVEDQLSKLKLLPREEMKPYDFNEE